MKSNILFSSNLLAGTLVAFFCSFFNVTASAEQHNRKCSNDKILYSQLTPEARQGSLTPEDSAILSSAHYCISYRDKLSYSKEPPKLTFQQVSGISSRYNAVWSKLVTDDEKIAFSHRFLKKFSETHEVFAKTDLTEQITIVVAGKNKDSNEQRSSQVYLTHSLNFSPADYYMLKQGLEVLAQTPNDQNFLNTVLNMRGLIQWVIKGEGKLDYFEHNDVIDTMLLPDGSLNYCIECSYHIDDILDNGGASYVGPYDWNRYSNMSYLTPHEGTTLENEICRINGYTCIAHKYKFYFNEDDTDTGEECVKIEYDDGHEVSGLYCQPFNHAETPGPE